VRSRSTPRAAAVTIELRYRVATRSPGNIGLGTLVELVRPATGTDEEAALARSAVVVGNVCRTSGGVARTARATKEELPRRCAMALAAAVALEDYATVRMDVAGVGRATVRGGGASSHGARPGRPEGGDELDDALRARVRYVDGLRMTGASSRVAAEYVPSRSSSSCARSPASRRTSSRSRARRAATGSSDRRGLPSDRSASATPSGSVISWRSCRASPASLRRGAVFRPLGELRGQARGT